MIYKEGGFPVPQNTDPDSAINSLMGSNPLKDYYIIMNDQIKHLAERKAFEIYATNAGKIEIRVRSISFEIRFNL